jgi:hypothetical protein
MYIWWYSASCAREIGVDVQLAGLVVGKEAIVFTREIFGVDHAVLHHEAAPFVVAVGGDEGVVEVEESEISHGGLFYLKRVKRLPF